MKNKPLSYFTLLVLLILGLFTACLWIDARIMRAKTRGELRSIEVAKSFQGLFIDSGNLGILVRHLIGAEGSYEALSVTVHREQKLLFETSVSASSFWWLLRTKIQDKILNLDISIVVIPRPQRILFLALISTVIACFSLALAFLWKRKQQLELDRRVAEQMYRTSLRLAHDIRGPLAVIRSSILSGEVVDNRFSAMTNTAVEQLDYLAGSLLEQFRAGPAIAPKAKVLAAPDEHRPFCLASITRNAVEAFSAKLTGSVNIDFQCSDMGVIAVANQHAGFLAIFNLLQNAYEAAPNEQIRIEVIKAGAFARVSIQDRGGGFPAEMLAKAGRESYTTKASGTGYGLLSVAQFAQAHGGSFDVENTELGARVSIALPLFVWSGAHCAMIDDTAANAQLWSLVAKKRSLSLDTFATVKDFCAHEAAKKCAIVFLDVHRDNDVDLAGALKLLQMAGVGSIVLTTGANASSVAERHSVAGVLGKTPPFVAV